MNAQHGASGIWGACLLLAFVVAVPVGAAGEPATYREARRCLRDAIDQGRAPAVASAADDLIRFRSEGFHKVLLDSLIDLFRRQSQLAKHLAPLERKEAELHEKAVKTLEQGGPRSESVLRKVDRDLERVQRDIRPVIEDQVKLRGFCEILVAVLGKTLDQAEERERNSVLEDFREWLESKERERRMVALEGLAAAGDPSWETVVASAAAREESEQVRILEILMRHDRRGSAVFAAALLKSESWSLRSTAATQLRENPVLEVVPDLIEALEQENGRLRGDFLQTLAKITGADVVPTATAWTRWWEENGDDYSGALQQVAAGSELDRILGYQTVAAKGFLLGARRILENLGMHPVPGEAAVRVPFEGISEEEGQAALQAVAETIQNCAPELRDPMVRELLIAPLDPARLEFTVPAAMLVLSRIASPESIQVLADLTLGWEFPDLSWEVRYQGALDLGASGQKDAVEPLLRLFRAGQPEYLLTAVVDGLAQMDSVVGLPAFMRLLERVTPPKPEVEVSQELQQRIFAHLAELTGNDFGDKFPRWERWWKEQQETQLAAEEATTSIRVAPGMASKTSGAAFFGIVTHSRQLCYVLDVSESMNEVDPGEEKSRLQIAVGELLRSIDELPDDAWFTVVVYSDDVKVWGGHLIQADAEGKADVRAWASELRASGYTNLLGGTMKALQVAGEQALRSGYPAAVDTIFLLTDGQPTAGRTTNPREVLKQLVFWARQKQVTIHCIGIGADHHASLLRGLAGETGGSYLTR